MEFAEVKRAVLGEIVRGGFSKPDEIPPQFLANLPPERIQRWMDKFFRSPKPDSFNSSPRLVNHFALGADPEFCFTTAQGEMYHAMNEGLHAGLAFGMDNNGRLVELRPAPSRFALEIVASILSELRWLAIARPNVCQYWWVSRPFVPRDGVGGHVHFGRKREESRELEVRTLDKLTALLLEGGVFNKEDNRQRRQAPGNYGAYGDIREQRHGYEYRTMPTWLDSPWMAYLTLTLSKLLVHDPTLIPPKQGVNVKKFVRNLLAYYKALDDDALIAYNALQVLGLPQQTGQDFKAAWGINYAQDVKTDVQIIPSTIYPTVADKQAIFDYLRTGRPIYPDVPVANWQTTKLPAGYSSALNFSQTYHRPGIGELIHDLAVSDNLPVTFEINENKSSFYIYAPQGTQCPKLSAVKDALGIDIKYVPQLNDRQVKIHLGEYLRTVNVLPKLKKLLLSGFLPIWKVADVRADSYAEWQRTLRPQLEAELGPGILREKRLRGKEITMEAQG